MNTPRTDAAHESWLPNEGVPLAFARQLETELAAAKALLLKGFKPIIATMESVEAAIQERMKA